MTIYILFQAACCLCSSHTHGKLTYPFGYVTNKLMSAWPNFVAWAHTVSECDQRFNQI